MLGNGIKLTTATTGTGSLTLSAVTGNAATSDVAPINLLNVPFAYSALDSTGLFIESGIAYMSATSTMVRAIISATFVAGVYNNSNPTAASLTGTTTIICTPHAATLESMTPTVDSQSAGISRLLATADRNTNVNTTPLIVLSMSYVPFLLRVAAPIVSLAINVTSAGSAGSLTRYGIYACNEKGYMGALLATTGDVVTTSTGLKTTTLSAPLSLPPGRYFTGIVTNNVTTPPTITHYASGSSNLIGGGSLGWSGTTPIEFRTEVLASAVLPTTANTTTAAKVVGANHVPLVYLGLA